MNLQDLTLQQLKEIVDGAPDKTADYFIADRSAREYYSLEFGSCFSSELGEWEDSDFRTEGELKNIYRHVLNLSDIRAQIEKIEAQKDINVTLWAESIENKGFDGSEKITVKLNPAKCRIVDPALPYDEPLTERELKTPTGLKHDQSKPRYSLIPAGALALVVDVLEYGATKYAPDGWKHVKNARERYYNASMRHIQSWWTGEQNDPETGLPHLAHAVCSLMFLMALKGEQGE